MAEQLIYSERVSSKWTEALFVALMLFFFGLFAWRLDSGRVGLLAVVFLGLGLVFAFYTLNYRTLVISLTPSAFRLTFGIFAWRVPLDNIAGCSRDEIPGLVRYGGAGIHFMVFRKRYRVSFNFLEHPRLVIALKRKVGLVRDVSFTTRQPEELIRLLSNI